MKFLSLNVDFDGPSFNFLNSRKPVRRRVFMGELQMAISQQPIIQSTSCVVTRVLWLNGRLSSYCRVTRTNIVSKR